MGVDCAGPAERFRLAEIRVRRAAGTMRRFRGASSVGLELPWRSRLPNDGNPAQAKIPTITALCLPLDCFQTREARDKSAVPRNGGRDHELYYETLEDAIVFAR